MTTSSRSTYQVRILPDSARDHRVKVFVLLLSWIEHSSQTRGRADAFSRKGFSLQHLLCRLVYRVNFRIDGRLYNECQRALDYVSIEPPKSTVWMNVFCRCEGLRGASRAFALTHFMKTGCLFALGKPVRELFGNKTNQYFDDRHAVHRVKGGKSGYKLWWTSGPDLGY